MSRLSDYLKSLFLVILIINFLPGALSGVRKYASDLWETKTKVGVVTITGVITNTERYANQLKKFFKNNEIKAIVLKIDSPGGAPGAAQALFQEIKDLKKEHVKPVIAYSENLCASAAYYFAAAADHIIISLRLWSVTGCSSRTMLPSTAVRRMVAGPINPCRPSCLSNCKTMATRSASGTSGFGRFLTSRNSLPDWWEKHSPGARRLGCVRPGSALQDFPVTCWLSPATRLASARGD